MENVVQSPAPCLEERHLIPGESLEILNCSPLFSGLSSAICSRMASTATVRKVARYGNLFEQREQIAGLFLLESGNVKHTQLGANGHEVLLRICGPGDVLAGEGFSGTSRHRYSARAMEESTVLSWRNDHVRKYMQQYPKLADNISHILSARLRELEGRIRELTTEEPTTRVALLLARLCKKIGTNADEG